MTTAQTIAIIGATSNLGSTVAMRLSKGHYRLLLMSEEFDKLDKLKNDLIKDGAIYEPEINSCAKEVSWEADIIVVASPYGTEQDVADKIREVAVGKIVISISNPVLNETNKRVASTKTSAAEKLQRMLPYSQVVKTFNPAVTENFISPNVSGKKLDTFIAGNSGDAIDTVSQIAKVVGFNPIVAGDLTVSRALENIEFGFVQQAIHYNSNWLDRWRKLLN